MVLSPDNRLFHRPPVLEKREPLPSRNEALLIRNCLSDDKNRFFIDRETLLLVTRTEASVILGIQKMRMDISETSISDLVSREQLREWNNLPEGYKIAKSNKGKISFLSVVEYLINKNGGFTKDGGGLPNNKYQTDFQISVIQEVLGKVPGWRKRLREPYFSVSI